MRISHLQLKLVRGKQTGAILILMAFIIGLATTAYLLKTYDPVKLRSEQDEKTYLALNAAKQALVSWAVMHQYSPGQMPWPDRREANNPNYDGSSDCVSNAFQYSYLLGQLPSMSATSPCLDPKTGLIMYAGLSTFAGLGQDFRDAQGNRLWYAVSRNLVRDYENAKDPIINPSVINSPEYSWMIVKDRTGNVLSNRVAVVIIAPGNVLNGQNRSGAAPDANQYLDNFKIGANNYSNANYDLPNEDFIIGQDSRNVNENDTSVAKPYYFNDKLVFITIDELIDAVTNRASSEASRLLNQYRARNVRFPYAAILGATIDNYFSSGEKTKGMLPIDVTDTCVCDSPKKCSCNFNLLSNVVFKRGGGTAWTSSEDSCTYSGASCTCTGAGSCSRGGATPRKFKCEASGLCTHDINGANNTYNYTVSDYVDIYTASPDCSISGTPGVCNNAGTFSIGLKEAPWFKANSWQDYFYYEWASTPPYLQVGTKNGVSALLIGAGQAIGTQNRLTSNPDRSLSDYLDSMENTNGDNKFEALNKQKNKNYNDQIYIVMP